MNTQTVATLQVSHPSTYRRNDTPRGIHKPPSHFLYLVLIYAACPHIPSPTSLRTCSQENYLNYSPALATSAQQQLRCVAKAAGSLAESDMFNTSVYRHGNWGLMPSMQVFGVAVPTTYMR